MIGNGVTDEAFDGDALVPFVHGMGLISDQLYDVTLIDLFYIPSISATSNNVYIFTTGSLQVVQWKLLECNRLGLYRNTRGNI